MKTNENTNNTIDIEPTTYKNHQKLMDIFKIDSCIYWERSKGFTSLLEYISLCRGFYPLTLVEVMKEMKQAFPKALQQILNTSAEVINGFTVYFDEQSLSSHPYYPSFFPSGHAIAKKALKNLHENFIIRTKPDNIFTEKDFETAIEIVTIYGYQAYGSSVVWLENNKLLVTADEASNVYFSKKTSELYGVYGKDYM